MGRKKRNDQNFFDEKTWERLKSHFVKERGRTFCYKEDHIETILKEITLVNKKSWLERLGLKKRETTLGFDDEEELRFEEMRDEMEKMNRRDALYQVKEIALRKIGVSRSIMLGTDYLESILKAPDLTKILFDAVDVYLPSEKNRRELYGVIDKLGWLAQMPSELHFGIRRIYEDIRALEKKIRKDNDNKQNDLNDISRILSTKFKYLKESFGSYGFDFYKIAYSPTRGLEEITNKEVSEKLILPWLIGCIKKDLAKTDDEMVKEIQQRIKRSEINRVRIGSGKKPIIYFEGLDAVQVLKNNIPSYDEQELAVKFFIRGSNEYRKEYNSKKDDCDFEERMQLDREKNNERRKKGGSKDEESRKITEKIEREIEESRRLLEENKRELPPEGLDAQTVSNAVRIIFSEDYNRRKDGSPDETVIEECAKIHNTRIDSPYLVLRKLGNGLSGTVYKARSKFLEENVALKLMDQENEEAKIMRIIRDNSLENIVRVNDAGWLMETPEGEKYTIVMEYVEGETLRKEIDNGKVDEKAARKYIKGILKGLKGLGEEGISYRDLRPENIMIRNGEPVLVDFGQATDMSNYPSEQGVSRTYGWFDDLFSFGLLAYSLVMGKGHHVLTDYDPNSPKRGPNTTKDWINENKIKILNKDGSVLKKYEDFIRGNIGDEKMSKLILDSLGYWKRISEEYGGEIMNIDEFKDKVIPYEVIKEIRQSLFMNLEQYLYPKLVSLVRN